jgi:hypothetical protein
MYLPSSVQRPSVLISSPSNLGFSVRILAFVRKRPFFINTVIARVIPRLVSLCVLSGVDILNLLMRARFIISFEKKLRPHATNQQHANRTTPTQVSSHRLSITVLHHSLPYRDDPYRLQDNTSRPYHTILIMKYGEHLKQNIAPEYGPDPYLRYDKADQIITELSSTKPSRYVRYTYISIVSCCIVSC